MVPSRLAALGLVLSVLSSLPACGGGEDPTGSGGSTTTTLSVGGGGAGGGGTAGAGGAGGSGGATTTAPVDKAADCIDGEEDLGKSLTSAFGRLDGTVLAVVQPTDTECFLPNDDHVVLQVLWNGEAYRMVVNVMSGFGDPDVHYGLLDQAPAGIVWEEGWHPGVSLDYVNDLGVHSGELTQYPMLELSQKMADEITLGQKVSVFAHSDNNPSSTHKIHRNGGGEDGAIVLDPDSEAPRTMIFHFANQAF